MIGNNPLAMGQNTMNSIKKARRTLELDTEYLEEGKESEEDPFPAKESIILPSFSYSKASSYRSDNSYNDINYNIKEIIKESLGFNYNCNDY